MRDLFDDFLEELRRQAKRPRRGRGPRCRTATATSDDADADERRRRAPTPTTTGRRRTEPPIGDGTSAMRPAAAARARAAAPSAGRSATTAPAGGRSPAESPGRSSAVVAVLLVFILFSVGLDLWTDAIWFQSVGFDARVLDAARRRRSGCSSAALSRASSPAPGNLWLAGRLVPPPDADRRRRVAPDAGRSAERGGSGGAIRRTAAPGCGGDRAGAPRPDHVRRRRHPRPRRRSPAWSSSVVAVFVALTIGGAVAASGRRSCCG